MNSDRKNKAGGRYTNNNNTLKYFLFGLNITFIKSTIVYIIQSSNNSTINPPFAAPHELGYADCGDNKNSTISSQAIKYKAKKNVDLGYLLRIFTDWLIMTIAKLAISSLQRRSTTRCERPDLCLYKRDNIFVYSLFLCLSRECRRCSAAVAFELSA
jgi:hypothetical protein